MIKSLSSPRRKMMADANLVEYGRNADSLSWISHEQARLAETDRARRLAVLFSDVDIDFKQTKPHAGPLAPGCRICGEGAWSCLFINGKCNCRCFYCPASQNEISVPTTNRIAFDTPRNYVDYVKHFDFKGVSISGGEPLLTFDRSLHYIEAVRKELGASLHIWLYTNGTLATREQLEKLRDAGLDEIRFDISAVDYDLTKVCMAADVIPCVTVEIPAIPEDLDRFIGLLPGLHDAGVKHLNLHQLRLTPHNFSKLSGRNYTFLHGEKVTVLESELAALTILEAVSRSSLKLPVNYCSFVYKRRYQQAATRRRNAKHILKGYETITENGFIRALSLAGDPETVGAMAAKLDREGANNEAWYLTGKKDQLFFHEALWPKIDFSAGKLQVRYSEALLSPSVSYRHTFREVRLNPERKIYVERRPLCAPLSLENAERISFENILSTDDENMAALPSIREEILEFELIRPGLQDYF